MIIHPRPGGERYLAHKVYHRGCEYPFSVVGVSIDGEIIISPYAGEIHSTVFVNGPLYVLDASSEAIAAAMCTPPSPAEISAAGLWHNSGIPLLVHFQP